VISTYVQNIVFFVIFLFLNVTLRTDESLKVRKNNMMINFRSRRYIIQKEILNLLHSSSKYQTKLLIVVLAMPNFMTSIVGLHIFSKCPNNVFMTDSKNSLNFRNFQNMRCFYNLTKNVGVTTRALPQHFYSKRSLL